jgi:hypothetical protein
MVHDIPGIHRSSAIKLIEHLETNLAERGPIVLTHDMRWEVLSLLREFLRQNPPRPITPRRIAKLVDDEMMMDPDYIEGDIAETITAARNKIALLTDNTLTAVKAAHLKYGLCRGVRGRPKKS